MAVQVNKKDRETSQNLAHRFTKTVRQSGLLLQVRGKQFRKKTKSALAKKRSAIRRVILKAEKIKQDKLDKPKEKPFGRNFGRSY
ncbi:MAG TPA: hypothetical protein VI937_03005 [Negativicutes bacterium]|nr:hypothetical protein [Negativicutes bacterium]